MRKYEVMYIINAETSEDDRTALIEKLHKIITDDGGKIEEINEWGIKEFAYPINHMTKGYYVVTTFTSEPAAVAEFERISLIESACIRHMVVNLEQ
ncbi:MAG: 30S ribosomal protein S6 [Erysipelotrichaceae bacterium]